jgi:Arc/MetJ-type ribon-helix-helix transcriptional regulator
MKTQVYSWRLSEELKSDLEREARERKLSVSAVIEMAARAWLKKPNEDSAGDEAQRQLHASAAACFGVIKGRNPQRTETARDAIRGRVRRRHARRAH